MIRECSRSNHNIRGMSLIETLMAVAIVSFVMSVTGTLIFNFFRAQTRLSAKSEANEFVAAVSKYLLSEQGCNQSLAGLPIPPITEVPFSLVGYSGYGSSAGNILGGFNVSPRLKIQTLTIKDKGLPPTVSMKGADSASSGSRTRLRRFPPGACSCTVRGLGVGPNLKRWLIAASRR